MKKIISFCICLVLVLSVLPTSFATAPQLELTKKIVESFDNSNLSYTVLGLNDSGDREYISKIWGSDYLDTIELSIVVSDKYNRVQIFCYDFMYYNQNDFTKVLRTVNNLNKDYNYVKFYCDEEENSVTAEFTCYVRLQTVGEVVNDMINTMPDIIEEAYNETLSVYSK